MIDATESPFSVPPPPFTTSLLEFATAGPPANPFKETPPGGENAIDGGFVIVNVTVTCWGLFEATPEATVTVAV